MFGRKRAFHFSMILLIVPTILSAFMPVSRFSSCCRLRRSWLILQNLAALNVCRGIAGIGGAIVQPASAGMIGTMYPAGRKRTLAFVAVTCGESSRRGTRPCLHRHSVQPVPDPAKRQVADLSGGVSGGSAGMLIAGAFLKYNRYAHHLMCPLLGRLQAELCRWTWRPCYLLIGLVYIWPWTIVTWLVRSDPPHTKRSKLDWLGSLLLGISLFLLLFGFTSSQTESRGWKTPCKPRSWAYWVKLIADMIDVPVLIAGSAIFGGLFVLRQIQLTRAMGSGNKPAPLIPRALLSAECWDLLIIYLSAACAWGSTDVSYSVSH
jgi:MFS family permease